MGCVALLDKNAQTLVEQFRDAQEAIFRVWMDSLTSGGHTMCNI